MTAPLLELEGTWEEIAPQMEQHFGGQRFHIVAYPAPLEIDAISPQVDEADILGKLISVYRMDTGITDLAQEHNHYVHGTPKHNAQR